MINKTYSVSEVFLSQEEIEMAFKEYIENHDNSPLPQPNSITYEYNSQGNKLNGIAVKLVYKSTE